MRIWIPHVTSQRLLFSQNFRNLSYVYGSGGDIHGSVSVDKGLDVSGGGYVIYSSRGADSVWALPWWSVFADVDVPASGSARCVLACGDPVIGDRFELGLSSSNEMQVVGGSTVVSDDALSAGRHRLLWVFTGGVVEFWADGVRIGTATVSLGSTTPPRLFVGMASDGSSRGLGSTIYSLDVYTYPLDEAEAFVVSAVEGWTPRNLLADYGGTYTDGLYFDGDDDGSYTFNTQPTLADLDMAQPGTSAWNTTDATLSKATRGYSSAYNALRVTSTADTFWARQAGCVNGNRIETWGYGRSQDGVAIPRVLVSSGAAVAWTGTSSPQWQRWQADVTSSGTELYLGSSSTHPGVVEFARVGARNLSCTHLNPYGSGTLAGKRFAQATAASMPWQHSSGKGVAGDGADSAAIGALSSAWASWTVAMLVETTDPLFAGAQYALGFGPTDAGITVGGTGTVGKVTLYDGSDVLTSTSAVTADTPTVIVCTNTGASQVLRLFGTEEVTANDVAVSITSPTLLARTAGVALPFPGSVRKLFMCNGVVSGADRSLIENYLLRAAQ